MPVEYFHVVFTLPHTLNALAQGNPQVCYALLFLAARETLAAFGDDPRHLGGEVGGLAILHTWGQTLEQHLHLHCVVPGGALARDRASWRPAKPGFLFPVRALARVFRGKYLAGLQRAFAQGELRFAGSVAPLTEAPAFAAFVATCRTTDWVVYAKPPFAGPAQVLAYLGPYTHRVAISNHRLVSVDDGHVRFRWTDYAHGHRMKTMTLPAAEFLRRFLLHVLPGGFVRIRHFGFLANRGRTAKLVRCRALLAVPPPVAAGPEPVAALVHRLTGVDITQCPVCRAGRLRRRRRLPAGPPPGPCTGYLMSPPRPGRPLRRAPPRPIRREGDVWPSPVSAIPPAPPRVSTILGPRPAPRRALRRAGRQPLPSAPGFGYNPHSR